jgi:hypothetical protein
MKTLLVLAAPLLLATPAFAQTSRQTITVRHNHAAIVQGSGIYVRDARTVAPFTAIESTGPERIEIVIGSAPSIEVEIDDNLRGNLTTRVENGVLRIGSTGGFQIARAPIVRVTMPRVRAITLSGSGGADITGLAGGDLTLTNRGSGAFRAAPGRVDRLTLNLSGSGDLDLARLQARNVAISLLGSGTARIRASDTITGRVSGSGTLFYGGSAPTVDVRAVGTGTVQRAD